MTFVSPGDVAIDAFAISKNDSTVFDPPIRAIYVGGTGDVVLRTRKGTTVTFSSVPAGAILPVLTDMVKSTTSATNLVGLY